MDSPQIYRRLTGSDAEKREVSGVSIEIEPIGFVRTSVEKVPRNWRVSDVEGELEIEKAYEKGSGT